MCSFILCKIYFLIVLHKNFLFESKNAFYNLCKDKRVQMVTISFQSSIQSSLFSFLQSFYLEFKVGIPFVWFQQFNWENYNWYFKFEKDTVGSRQTCAKPYYIVDFRQICAHPFLALAWLISLSACFNSYDTNLGLHNHDELTIEMKLLYMVAGRLFTILPGPNQELFQIV